MEKVVVGFLGLCALMFFGSIMGALFGGMGGWIVGFFWTDPILNFLSRFGVDTAGMTCWQIGVSLGFMGGFFKSTQTSSDKK